MHSLTARDRHAIRSNPDLAGGSQGDDRRHVLRLSNAIENIHAPRARIEALVAEKTSPKNRSEQEIAGYRDVLGLIHANQTNIPFEPRYVEQLHGNLYRYVGDRTAGHWKRLDNQVEEERPDGTKVERFTPVSAADTPEAMRALHESFNRELAQGTYPPLLLIDEAKDTYYDALAKSTQGWHHGTHDLAPWTSYFLGILIAAYGEFESRATLLAGRGSKKALITTFIDSLLTEGFTVAAVRHAAPGVSDGYIKKVLLEPKKGRAHRTDGHRPRRPVAALASRPVADGAGLVVLNTLLLV
jgi:hypothetical protein